MFLGKGGFTQGGIEAVVNGEEGGGFVEFEIANGGGVAGEKAGTDFAGELGRFFGEAPGVDALAEGVAGVVAPDFALLFKFAAKGLAFAIEKGLGEGVGVADGKDGFREVALAGGEEHALIVWQRTLDVQLWRNQDETLIENKRVAPMYGMAVRVQFYQAWKRNKLPP